MNRYFESDIDKLERLKKGFFVTLASTVVLTVLTAVFTTCYAIGKNNAYPATSAEKDQLIEIAENDPDYKQACRNFEIGFREELEDGKISQKQFDKQMDYLETPEFINRVVNSAKTHAINEKVAERKEKYSKMSAYAVLSGAAAVGSAVACGVIKKSRKKLKSRWYSEEEGRGL
ncbi:MAG: hypothetical protein J6A28_02845 [Clostridia bacterium]|nr:hypothetical protein [Clostridia bacterium]